jgi:PAS domain S-box-containing protein
MSFDLRSAMLSMTPGNGVPVATRLADGLPIGIAAIDNEGRQEYVNEAFARMIGWPREVLIGAMPPFVYWPEDERDTIAVLLREMLEHKAPHEGITLRFQRRDGSRFDALMHAGVFVGPSGSPAGWVAAITDISSHLALQRDLEANDARLRAAYAAERAARRAAEDSARRLEALQRATADLTGALTPEEVAAIVLRAAIPTVGGVRGLVALVSRERTALDVIATVGYAETVEARKRRVAMESAFPLADAVRERKSLLFPNTPTQTGQYPLLDDPRAESRTGATASIPLLAAGTVIGAVGINWNEEHEFTADETAFLESIAHQCAQATERARLYQEEQRARREAEEANRAKSDFLAAMSHELRTPLNAIAGYVDLLTLGIRGPLNDEQSADLERIRFNQRHLTSLIEDVLAFARIEAGRLEVERVAVPLDATLRTAYPMVMPQMHARGVRFVYDGCPRNVIVQGDAERIVQICVNLLSNAAKATSARGEVRLSCALDKDRVLVRVSDTGTGIPRDKLEAIFSPFTQLGRSLKTPRAGAGLGLSISRGLAEAMGGSLEAASHLGTGSTFTLTLLRG